MILGLWLQLNENDAQGISGDKEVNALLIITGERAGKLIEQDRLKGPAIDIGIQVDIVAHEPTPI